MPLKDIGTWMLIVGAVAAFCFVFINMILDLYSDLKFSEATFTLLAMIYVIVAFGLMCCG